jgi:hypothetical protein
MKLSIILNNLILIDFHATYLINNEIKWLGKFIFY